MEQTPGWIRSPLAGGVVGLFAGGLTILLLEGAGHALLGTADPSDLSSVTGPMFASVLVAWVVGSAVAGAVATYWARARSARLGAILGVILLAGAVSNMFVIPHPVWLVVSAVILMPAGAILAARWTAVRPAA